ncbi:protein of unknown function [Petrocella atlantisensis]|uniref:Uncharacterized protein n=1 Tax=Petrocella atlantisensis TaxID=2173034 RepID=A0A3P7S0J5_9FIRM|nr:protein of unknown function [Petrocella atlantisensis]
MENHYSIVKFFINTEIILTDKQKSSMLIEQIARGAVTRLR